MSARGPATTDRAHRRGPQRGAKEGAGARRADIQGLRALAVLGVVVFHAGLPLSGGYLGVDVFFVVSGFVITAMLERDRTPERTIDFREFYRRRFARLTPALVVMVIVTVLLSLVVMLPFGLQQTTAKTGVGAIALIANFVIGKTSGGYFDLSAEANPLLHTWSLSVEEQIYLVFPAVILCAWWLAQRRIGRWAVPGVVALTGIGSYAVMVAHVTGRLSGGQPWFTGFYSPVTRLWEFVAGSLLAYVVAWTPLLRQTRRMTVVAAGAVAMLGLAVIVASMILFDAETETPGLTTIIPVGATVLVIAAGSWLDNPVSRSLGCAPARWLGDRSYSVYLWHWPVIVFAAYLWPESELVLVMAGILAFVPALWSYQYVEQPGRRRRTLRGRRFAGFVALVVVPGIAVSLGALVVANTVLKPWFSTDPARIAHVGRVGWVASAPRHEWAPCRHSDFPVGRDSVGGVVPNCRRTNPGKPLDLAVVGDSHAAQLDDGVAVSLKGRSVLLYSANGLPVVTDPQFSDVYRWIEGPDGPPEVLISMLWSRSPDYSGLADTVRGLVAAGRRVWLLEDNPDYQFGPERCKYRGLFPTRCTQRRVDFDARNRSRIENLRAVAAQTGADLLTSVRYFCNVRRCSMLVGDALVYRDANHLNRRGSKYLLRRLVADRPELALPPSSAPGAAVGGR